MPQTTTLNSSQDRLTCLFLDIDVLIRCGKKNWILLNCCFCQLGVVCSRRTKVGKCDVRSILWTGFFDFLVFHGRGEAKYVRQCQFPANSTWHFRYLEEKLSCCLPAPTEIGPTSWISCTNSDCFCFKKSFSKAVFWGSSS